MAKKRSVLDEFTPEELEAVHRAARAVFDEVAYDLVGDGTVVTRAEVLEVVTDADRLETRLRRTSPGLADRVRALDYERACALVRPAFPHARYGL